MEMKLKRLKINNSNLQSLPNSIGIYVFWNNNFPIYIGKSVNLKNRVRSYFLKGIEGKTLEMVNHANYISYLIVYSELEALIFEANLIKKYKPKYNISLKDDKSSLYIEISLDKYPTVKSVRKTNLKTKKYYGPFQSSADVKKILRSIRRIYPYATHKPNNRECIYSQIGLCNPCPSIIEKEVNFNHKKILTKKYLNNINLINRILNGGLHRQIAKMQKQMLNYSRNENYPKALDLRRQITALDNLTTKKFPIEGYLKNPNFIDDIYKKEITDLKNILSKIIKINNLSLIECYDVSHFQGSFAAASMVTFINGYEDKTKYRHFKIRQNNKQSDTDSLSEIINRRIKHFKDWGKPDLIIVDGGKGQLSAFLTSLKKYQIPTIGLAKRFETIVYLNQKDNLYGNLIVTNRPALALLKRIRNESHRFAQRYHHKLVEMFMLK